MLVVFVIVLLFGSRVSGNHNITSSTTTTVFLNIMETVHLEVEA